MNTKLTKEQIEAAAKWCAGVLGDEPFTRKGLSRNAPRFTEIMSRSGRNLYGTRSCSEYLNDMNTARRLWKKLGERCHNLTREDAVELGAMLDRLQRETWGDCAEAIWYTATALGELDPNECGTKDVDSQVEEEVSDK